MPGRPKRSPKEWSPRGEIPGEPIWPEFTDSYLATALWTAVDQNGDSLEKTFSSNDFSDDAVKEAVRDTNAFIRKNQADLDAVGDAGQHGHDFWLTRNGYGAGFWDRGYGDVGQRLTMAARRFGELNVYIGDDGKLYFA